MKTLSSSKAPKAVGPYSQAVSVQNTVYASGQLPLHPDTGVLETDIQKATAQCLENLGAVLHEARLTLADCAKVTVYLTDMADFTAMNEVYTRYFTPPFPARVCVAVAALPKNAKIEIDCIAVGNATL